MARAGHCSQCGNYVFLRPDGGCANGHGPECISNVYDVPDAGPAAVQQPAAYQVPQYSAPGPYAAPAYPEGYAAPAAPPKKKRTGLVVAIVIIALLLLCCCGVGVAMFAGAIPNPLASAEHQKVAAAGELVKALTTADSIALVKVLPADAVAAADAATWVKVLADSEIDSSLTSSSWENDVLTLEFKDGDGTERKIILTAVENDRVEARTFENGEENEEPGYFTMVKEATGWKVRALGSKDEEFIRFDADTVKQMQEESGD